MTVVTLGARGSTAGFVAAEGLRPDLLGATEREIAATPLSVGRDRVPAGDLFSVRVEARESVDAAGPELRVEPGEVRLHGLGAGMRSGRILVDGDVGDRVGAGLAGGEIQVLGRAGDWAGAEMSGGLLRIEGAAGFRAGGALAGAPRGMVGGLILIGGSTGDEAGASMRRGLIAIAGGAGARAGFHAIAGTVLVLGDAGPSPALATKRGTLIVHGRVEPPPGFRPACDYAPAFVRVYLRRLREIGFEVPRRYLSGRYRRFVGDFTQLGKGEILRWQET